MAKIPQVNKYLLRTSQERVKKLERETEVDMFLLQENRLGIEKIRLLVPPGIAVYQVIAPFRNKGIKGIELFFTIHENAGDFEKAYLSKVALGENEGLNCRAMVIELMRYPWYDNNDSSKIFNTISHSGKNSNLYLVNYKLHISEKHPLIKVHF